MLKPGRSSAGSGRGAEGRIVKRFLGDWVRMEWMLQDSGSVPSTIHEAPIMERRNERKTGTSNLKVQDSDTQWTYPKRTLVTVPVPHGTDTRETRGLSAALAQSGSARPRPLTRPQVPRVPVSQPPLPLGFWKT